MPPSAASYKEKLTMLLKDNGTFGYTYAKTYFIYGTSFVCHPSEVRFEIIFQPWYGPNPHFMRFYKLKTSEGLERLHQEFSRHPANVQVLTLKSLYLNRALARR